MNTGIHVITTTIVVLSFAHGVFWCVLRLIRPQVFMKGYSLAQRLGFRSSTVYFAFFVLMPLVVGAVLLAAGMDG